jgi:8-oxo-dGTP pyrophosphatase MutT (NUDIX family)
MVYSIKLGTVVSSIPNVFTKVILMVQKEMVNVYPIRYRDGNLEYLMIKRATVSYNWQCVSGSVGHTMGATDHPKDESPLECAKRELFEETGYTPVLMVPFDPPQGFFNEDEAEGEIAPPELLKVVKEITFYIFIARIDQLQDPVLNPTEHTAWKWCNFETAYNIIQWAVEKKALRIINDFLTKNPLNK